MAMYTSGELEELKTCPYNASHRITAKRFSFHLVKCRKANPHVKLVTCPLFAQHKIPEPELEYHIKHVCDQRKELEQQLYVDEPIQQRWQINRNVQEIHDDTWETIDGPSYNPQIYCESNRIIRTIQVEPPSVRKQFRQAERKRHQMLDQLERDRNQLALKAKQEEQSELSEREASTSEASRFSVNDDSDIEAKRNHLSKILAGRERGGEKSKKNEQQRPGIVPPKLMTETSNRESATSDESTLVESLSDLNLADTKKNREEEWVTVSHGHARGRGRKIRK